MESNGQLFYISKSEGIIEYSSQKDKNYISLIRKIVDVDTYESLAILLLTIDEKTIQAYFDEVGKEYNSQFYIIDSKGNYIIKPSDYDEKMDEYVLKNSKEQKEDGYEIYQMNNEKMILVHQSLEIEDWTLVGVIPNGKQMFNVETYSVWILLLISLNLFVLLVCSISLTKLIFSPLYKMQKHMKLIESGQFDEMELEQEKRDEINDLKRGFNQMVVSIKELIEKVKLEEKIIVKNELDLIQAQINPHFLYNTLDAVSALALIKDNENCFKITQALGSFYRNSLGKGRDLISIQEELDCISSYVTILNMRYDNQILLHFEVEESILDYKILKLILQPIVENAVHHGLRNKKGNGTILIKGYQDEEEIIFVVSDDGIGMPAEKIEEILLGKMRTNASGFGLYSSIQRISIYYNIEKPVTIVSEEGIGTEITIRTKVIKGAMEYENKDLIGG